MQIIRLINIIRRSKEIILKYTKVSRDLTINSIYDNEPIMLDTIIYLIVKFIRDSVLVKLWSQWRSYFILKISMNRIYFAVFWFFFFFWICNNKFMGSSTMLYYCFYRKNHKIQHMIRWYKIQHVQRRKKNIYLLVKISYN